jgi:hypothetical protein
MIARWLLSVGVVAASVGFTFFGMATSTYELHTDMRDVGVALMAGGGVASIIGLFWYRADERKHG